MYILLFICQVSHCAIHMTRTIRRETWHEKRNSYITTSTHQNPFVLSSQSSPENNYNKLEQACALPDFRQPKFRTLFICQKSNKPSARGKRIFVFMYVSFFDK